jgi:hypothetical protein
MIEEFIKAIRIEKEKSSVLKEMGSCGNMRRAMGDLGVYQFKHGKMCQEDLRWLKRVA